MRRFVTAGFLALFMALSAGCSDQDKQSPTEPSFKKVSNLCAGTEFDTELVLIQTNIGTVFKDRQAERGALQIVDNIARKVCADQQNLDATPVMAEGFYEHVVHELPYIHEDLHDDAFALVALVFDFALQTTTPTPPLPPGAFDPETGVVAIVIPGTDEIIQTPNLEAALVIDPASFGGDEPVTVALSRIPDDEQPIPGFLNFAERYEIVASRDPDVLGNGVLVALCVPDDQDLPENLAIGHYSFRQVEILVPMDPGEAVDCTYAATGYPFPETTLGLLNKAQKIIQPVVDRILGVKPLHAMYFAGTGLGGRTKSFSPFVPVAVTIDVGETVQLTVATDATWISDDEGVATVDVATGEATGIGGGTATITALVGASSYTVKVKVNAPVVPVLPLTCSAEPSGGDRFYRGFYFPEYPGIAVARVDLQFSADFTGSYELSLTARSGAYGSGSLIGTAQATVALDGRSNFIPTSFVFPTPLTPITAGSVVTFEIGFISGPEEVDPSNILVFYRVPSLGDPECPVIETNGTTPLLDTFRRNGVWLTVFESLPVVID